MLVTGVHGLIDGMKRLDVFFSGEEAAEICRKGLAVPPYLTIRAISSDVVEQICCNVPTRSVRDPRLVAECVLDVNKSAGAAFVVFHE